MKYFAEINKDNIVLRVLVVESVECAKKLFGGNWVETFPYDVNKNLANIGYSYIPELDNFCSPQPYNNWILNKRAKWEPLPTDTNVNIIPEHIKPKIIISENDRIYKWNNELIKWDRI